jgi:WS/DGAT/MGAT family acyltransferase
MGIYDPSTAEGGVVRFKDVLKNFESRLHALPLFRTRVVKVPGGLDRPYWVQDDSFDVEYHIRHIALPKPGDWRQLCIQVARLHARGLDMDRPLWECIVIEGLNNIEGCPPGSFAVYIKVHHAVVDGDLGQHIMGVLHDLEPNPTEPRAPSPEINVAITKEFEEPRLGNTELLTRAVTNRFKNAIPNVKTAVKVVGDMGDTLIKMAKDELPAPQTGPKTRFDDPVGPHRVMDAVEFSLPELKEIKNATNTTINDVCVTIIGGALRKYLEHHGELPAESIIGNMPVNMRKRGLESDEANQVGAMMAKIHTEIADPVDRLHAVHDSVADAKKFIGTPLVEPLKLVGLFPPFLAKPLVRLYVDSQATRLMPIGTPAVITNVPGPRFDLYANGAKLVKIHLIGLCEPGVALFNAIFSLGDKLTITFLCGRDIMPDPAFYRQCLEESYAELKEAVLGKNPKAKV